MENKTLKNSTQLPALFIFIIVATIFLIYPSAVTKGAAEGLKICAAIVIPCLFPFTVASIFAHKSGGIMWIGKRLNRFSRSVFGISGSEFTVVIISLVGGYPIGAKIADSMYQQGEITKYNAERLMLFSINASPAFFISTVGFSLFNSYKVGIILLVSNLVSCLFLTAIIGKMIKKGSSETLLVEEYYSLGDSLVLSVSEAAQVFISICAWVTLFSALTEIICLAELSNSANVLIFSLLEVTVGCVNAAKSGIPLFLNSFILGFGGLSTICQVCTAAKHIRPSFSKIFIGRIIHGVTASLISFALFKIFPISQATFSNSVNVVFTGFELTSAPIFLFLTAILFFIYLKS